jgi:uncharacterized protein (DUF1501 family)
MLTLLSDRSVRESKVFRRREFLQVGTLGIGGLTLASLLATKARAAGVDGVLKEKSVVILNLQGGPTHIETFDPKMTAPVEYRAMFGEVQTSIPGVTFGSHMANLARLADRMAIVRCFRHGIGSHGRAANFVSAGGNPTGANLGSIYARIAGTNSPKTGMPTNCVIQPAAVGDQYKMLGAQIQRITELGNLPTSYKPFDPSSGGEIVENMKLKIPQNRLDDRRLLLERLDDFKRQVDGTGVLDGTDQFQQQAYDVILGGISGAFNLSKEDPALVERYDTSMFDIPDALYKKKNKNLLKQSPISLGKQMLMARRLIEADCRFVTVTSAGWDMHGNAFGVDDGMPLLGSAVDRCVSAFLEDLEDRGLSENVLLIITGEFGRTPRINKKGGRDHWGNLCTLAFAGGGLPMGQIIGKSDRTASLPSGDVVTAGQLLGTVMHTLLDIGKLRLVSGIPNDLARIIDTSHPIPQLT